MHDDVGLFRHQNCIVPEHIPFTIMSVAIVNNLKESLAKNLSAATRHDAGATERSADILQRLDECSMTIDILSETLVGTVVSKFKSHPELGESAKTLIKKWKKLAKRSGSDAKGSGDSIEAASAQTIEVPAKVKPKLERRESASSLPDNADGEWSGLPDFRQNICKKLYSFLVLAKPMLLQTGVNESAIDHLTAPRAAEIEAAIFVHFKDKQAYVDKARSLAFNLKKNTELCQDVLLGHIEASDLVQMSSEQLASDEIRKARAEEAKKVIESKRLDWEQANEAKINEMCGIRGDLLKASLFTCSRCKSTKTTSTQKQTRSADEPMTVFVLCLNCGKRWKC